jgi:serine/threonine-protein kinase
VCLAKKYRLLRQLAVGGMGEIWQARNEATRADVALKLLRSKDAADDAGRALRFRTEAQLGAMLSHRNIVRIFDLIEEDDGSLVLVMELLVGESLARYLEHKGRLTNAEAVAIALPILSGLAHAHDSGIVHRDVTPANIFLARDPDGHIMPKLVDFGIAKLPAAGSHTLDGRILGTPRYMAPEQIRARQDIDGRADIFSAAVVLYEAITGVSPFDAATPSASIAAVLEAPVDPHPAIDPRLWLELQRALSKRPYERHRNAEEMAAALRNAVDVDETSLDAFRRSDLPSPSRLEDAQKPGPSNASAQTSEEHLLPVPRRAPSKRIVLAASVAVCAAIGTLVAVQLATRKPAASEMIAPREIVREASATPAAQASAPVIAPSTTGLRDRPPPTARPIARPAPSPSSQPPRVKAIATTPGF